MTRYKIYYNATKIPKSSGTGGAGTRQRYVDYDRKSYSSRERALVAMKGYEKIYKGSDYRSVGAKFEVRSAPSKRKPQGFFGGSGRGMFG